MARPVHIDTEKLLETARRLFLAKGYKVGTAEIAREAGISEGSIFKRFHTKADLFRAALGFPEFDENALIQGLDQYDDMLEGLTTLICRLVGFERQVVPRIIMLWGHPSVVSLDLLHRDTENPPKRILAAIAAFLSEQSQKGRLNVANPQVTARAILGACHSFAFFEFMDQTGADQRETESFARSLARLLWEGIAP